jgi:Arc/MetJ-type ribon-helix-helix transcriptional regulator
MANRFKQAAPKAKKLYKTGRYKTYADAMKKALQLTAPKHRKKKPASRPARKRARRAVGKRSTAIIVTAPGSLHGINAGQLKTELKRRINSRIDHAVVQKYHATKKSAKRRIQKSINAAKAELRKLL